MFWRINHPQSYFLSIWRESLIWSFCLTQGMFFAIKTWLWRPIWGTKHLTRFLFRNKIANISCFGIGLSSSFHQFGSNSLVLSTTKRNIITFKQNINSFGFWIKGPPLHYCILSHIFQFHPIFVLIPLYTKNFN